MPDPINASVSSSVYDPNQPVSEAGCDPTSMSCGPTAPLVTIPPVVIEGDASTHQLVRGYDKHQAPDCRNEATAAGVGCAGVAISVASTLMSAPTGIGLVLGAASTVASTVGCYRLLHDYNACKEQGAARADAADRCEARGGTPNPGFDDNEIICEVAAK